MPAANRTTPTFTPGPWTVYAENDYDSLGRFEVIGADQRDLAMIRPSYRTVDEQRANAHLIASAPALYAALKSLADLYAELRDAELIEDSDMTELKAARAALAQAEGRSS